MCLASATLEQLVGNVSGVLCSYFLLSLLMVSICGYVSSWFFGISMQLIIIMVLWSPTPHLFLVYLVFLWLLWVIWFIPFNSSLVSIRISHFCFISFLQEAQTLKLILSDFITLYFRLLRLLFFLCVLLLLLLCWLLQCL